VTQMVLRDRAGNKQQVTPFELFFDLVFVFAVTQLSHTLLEDLTPGGTARTLLLLLVVWSAWVTTAWVTNWLDLDRLPVRLMLVWVMLASLFMSAAIPRPSTIVGCCSAPPSRPSTSAGPPSRSPPSAPRSVEPIR
jgi:low temperature requirement protein LtrA